MSKKLFSIFAVIAIVVCLLMGNFLFQKIRTKKLSVPKPQSQETVFDPLDATYTIDGAAITLVNGAVKQAAVPGSAEMVTTKIFGEPVSGDINGDGKNDAAIFLVQDGAGSGTFYYAAAAFNTSTGTIGTNAIFLGDRIAPDTLQIANGIMTVNYADRKASDPMSASPSVGVSKYLVLASSTLYDTPTDIYPLPSGFSWNEKQAATMKPGDINVTSTLVGIKIESQPITNITDLSAKSLPFDNYYKKKLVAAGWAEDNALAAGGSGAEITGYRKGNDYIILEYTSVFKNMPVDSPETCPCDLTFSIFSGTALDAR
jgi:hypothetical protein